MYFDELLHYQKVTSSQFSNLTLSIPGNGFRFSKLCFNIFSLQILDKLDLIFPVLDQIERRHFLPR